MQTLSDKDRVLFEATPMLMAPRFGVLPELAIGTRRLISASDGVYLEVRSKALHICRRIAEVRMPYGDIVPFTKLAYGIVPNAILSQAYRYAAENAHVEVAACLMLDHANQSYQWHYPQVISSDSGHIRYQDAINDDELVIDFHSHAAHPAFFSAQDDQSDLSRPGPYIAVVAGHCDRPRHPSHASRIVCSPYLFPIPG